jgi:hypothetical protein
VSATLSRLLSPPAEQRSRWLACWLVAAGAHLCAAGWLSTEPPPQPVTLVSEVELIPVAPPAPPLAPSEPPPPVPPSPPMAAKPAPRAPRAQPPSMPAAAAKAGALLTAAATPAVEKAPEPVRFMSDPSGQGYGHGIVARGGQAEHGTGSELPPVKAAPRLPGERLTPADRLQRQPTLIGDGCRGYFPAHARPNTGQVSLIATLRASGAIARLEIEWETPQGEGFAAAARTCLTRQRFTPALDEHGEPTATRTRIKLFFSR